jgi:hypothetical protein
MQNRPNGEGGLSSDYQATEGSDEVSPPDSDYVADDHPVNESDVIGSAPEATIDSTL